MSKSGLCWNSKCSAKFANGWGSILSAAQTNIQVRGLARSSDVASVTRCINPSHTEWGMSHVLCYFISIFLTSNPTQMQRDIKAENRGCLSLLLKRYVKMNKSFVTSGVTYSLAFCYSFGSACIHHTLPHTLASVKNRGYFSNILCLHFLIKLATDLLYYVLGCWFPLVAGMLLE